ncbi:MAG: FHA domain-containing protein [Deltaproteobacteria bacterium]|nr:FHA domain-containing protein [Deltaproteobacteria bacterium]
MDQSKKTMRHFYCRDILWDTFEQMANDFDCSIDYLINEAMRYYATSKNYLTRQAAGGAPAKPALANRPPARMPDDGGYSPARRPAGPPPPPSTRRPSPGRSFGSGLSKRPVRHTPKPEGQSAPILYLIYNNQRVPVDKDQFIIGRGSKTSDLAIKDGNISRKHAAVIRRNGVYYIKDLGSTNGIDYKGMRIDNKRIEEGDVFHLCDHEVQFTFRG